MADSPASALALLAEALDHLAAHRVEVVLAPVDGVWRLELNGQAVTTGDVVAKAIGLGMMGWSERLQ